MCCDLVNIPDGIWRGVADTFFVYFLSFFLSFYSLCGVLNVYDLTEWSRVFLERLVVVPLFKKLSEFYGTK